MYNEKLNYNISQKKSTMRNALPFILMGNFVDKHQTKVKKKKKKKASRKINNYT